MNFKPQLKEEVIGIKKKMIRIKQKFKQKNMHKNFFSNIFFHFRRKSFSKKKLIPSGTLVLACYTKYKR